MHLQLNSRGWHMHLIRRPHEDSQEIQLRRFEWASAQKFGTTTMRLPCWFSPQTLILSRISIVALQNTGIRCFPTSSATRKWASSSHYGHEHLCDFQPQGRYFGSAEGISLPGGILRNSYEGQMLLNCIWRCVIMWKGILEYHALVDW